MRIDYASFCIGLLAGFTGFVIIFYLADSYGIQSAELCLPGESLVTCVRDWADVLAIIGAAATVIFILLQMRGSDRQHQDNVALQTLPMRASIARFIVETIEPLERMLQPVLEAEMKYATGNWTKIRPASVHDALNEIARWTQPTSLTRIIVYDDGTLIELCDKAERAALATAMTWSRPDGYGNSAPISVVTKEACASLQPVISACYAFTEAARALHAQVSSGTAPTVRERLRRHIAIVP